MRTFITSILLLLIISAFSQSVYSPQLTSLLNDEKSAEYAEINIFLDNQESIEDLAVYLDEIDADFDTRVKEVTGLLKRNSELSIEMFLQDLDDKKIYFNNKIKSFKTYWGVNMLNMEVKTSVIPSIASFENVRYIDLNTPRYKIFDSKPPILVSEKATDEAEIGLKTINAHMLWELGYTGRNVLFLSMDTGVFPDHPAIADNFAGNHFPMSQCWYGVRNLMPSDHASSSHGTHTTGTVLGLDEATNDTIGVAFNAMWIASDPVASSVSDLLDPADFMDVFQWVFDPDGNPETTDDVPRVINNSWGYDYSLAMEFGACEMVEAEILVAIETAGICSPFSAGNEGPGASTTGFPALRAFNVVNPMAIGALQNEGTEIASFSSRGPTPCIEELGSLQIKPEVSAPGVNVRSCVGHEEYGSLSGTSMACPHVSGALLLLAEAFPQASAFELKNALYITAVDLGDVGEDNVYGNGLIDVYAAYQYLELSYVPEPPVTNQYDIAGEIQDIGEDETVFCSDENTFNADVLISNMGLQNVSQINIEIFLNDQLIIDSLLDITIVSGSDYLFESEVLEFAPGWNYLHTVVKLETENNEYNRFNNADIKSYYMMQEDDFPYSADFSDFDENLTDSNWLIENPDNMSSWENRTWGNESQYSALAMDFGNYGTREWQEDYANMPILHLPDQENLYLSFTYAYQKRVEFIFKDTVVVELSTDCGQTFPYELWRNGGENMATVDGNAYEELFIPQTEEDFDTINVSLAEYKNQDVIIRFVSKNDRGSIIYLDYVYVGDTQISDFVLNSDCKKLKVYPIPTDEKLNVILPNGIDEDIVEIINTSGQIVVKASIGCNKSIIDISSIDEGVYFVRSLKTGSYIKIIII